MSNTHRALRWLAAVVCLSALTGTASASAFEAHNFIEPPFGEFGQIGGLAVNQSNGNVHVFDSRDGEVSVFGAGGGSPAGGGPAGFTGAGSPAKNFGGEYHFVVGFAVDNACYQHEQLTGKPLSEGECEALDPSNNDIYIYDLHNSVVDKYRLNGSAQYEYVSQIRIEGSSEGLTVDSGGNVYVMTNKGIVEYGPGGEELRALGGVFGSGSTEGQVFGRMSMAVAPNGTIYAKVFVYATGGSEVLELKRSSLTGPVEGEAKLVPNTDGVRGVAFDLTSGQLFVDLGSSAEALNAAHEVASRFGTGIISGSEELEVNEKTGEVYVANGTEVNIDRFGPGLPAALPAVDAPPPAVSNVTRTSALLSGTIDPGNATTHWQLQYVRAGEYQPAAANPYAAGGSTGLTTLAASASGAGIGPLALTGLLAGTTYDYRLVASNELGTTYGPNHSFTTAAAMPPLATTGVAGEVTQTSVTLTGTVATEQLQTSYGFEVGLDTGYGGAKLFGNAGSGGIEAVSASLGFLIPGTTYHYRLVASNADGTSYGQDVTFTTPPVPALISQPATALLIPSPTATFPSVSGAITKAQGTKKKARKKKHKAKSHTRAKHGKRHARH